MNLENYELLQVSESATDEEIKEAYERLKAKYNEEKWQDGEAGNNAARMLGKIEVAYNEIMQERKETQQQTSGSNAFDEVSACIRSGDIPRAQQLLDGFNERNAEWHYLQSVVFYKKNWMNERNRYANGREQPEIPRGLRQTQFARAVYATDGRRAEHQSQPRFRRGTDGRELVCQLCEHVLYVPLRQLSV